MNRWLMLLLWFVVAPLMAHPLAPALLDLHESAGGKVDVLLKTSITLSRKLQQPTFPARCHELDRQWPQRVGDGRIERWRMDCGTQGLAGARIAMAGDQDDELNVVIRIERADGSSILALLSPATPSFVVPTRQSWREVLRRYGALGVRHLWTGLDHLSFVLGLLLWLRKRRTVLFAITAFTLGHSVTLALATLQVLHVKQAPVELGIALSILWLAVELSTEDRARPRHGLRRVIALPFLFGLLHGLGFAGALVDLGLPAGNVPLALFGFNVGIELGQLGVIAAAGSLVWLARRFGGERAGLWARPACVQLIGVMAALWCWQRGWTLLS